MNIIKTVDWLDPSYLLTIQGKLLKIFFFRQVKSFEKDFFLLGGCYTLPFQYCTHMVSGAFRTCFKILQMLKTS